MRPPCFLPAPAFAPRPHRARARPLLPPLADRPRCASTALRAYAAAATPQPPSSPPPRRHHDARAHRFRDTPALLTGHAAVLGVALAAGALLIDLVRALAAVAVTATAVTNNTADGEENRAAGFASRSKNRSELIEELRATRAALAGLAAPEADADAARLSATEEVLMSARRRAAAVQQQLEMQYNKKTLLARSVADGIISHDIAPSSEDRDVARALRETLQQMEEARTAAEEKAANAEVALVQVHETLAAEVARHAELIISRQNFAREGALVEERMDAASRTIDELKVRMLELEAAKQDELQAVAGEMRGMQESVDSISAELEEARAEAVRLFNERESINARSRRLEDDAHRREEELQHLRAALADRRAKQEETVESQRIASRQLEGSLASAKAELAALREDAKARDHDACTVADSLRSALSARDVELAHLSAQLDAAMRDAALPKLKRSASRSENNSHSVSETAEAVADELMATEPPLLHARKAEVDLADEVKQGNDKEDDENHTDDSQMKSKAGREVVKSGAKTMMTSRGSGGNSAPSAKSVELELAVARQRAAKAKPEQRETPPAPKPRRGRPPKASSGAHSAPTQSRSTTSSSREASDGPIKRCRGRPRKAPQPSADADIERHRSAEKHRKEPKA